LPDRLAELKNTCPDLETHLSEPATIMAACEQADLVVGAVMVSGRRAPIVLTNEMKRRMPEGSVIVDGIVSNPSMRMIGDNQGASTQCSFQNNCEALPTPMETSKL